MYAEGPIFQGFPSTARTVEQAEMEKECRRRGAGSAGAENSAVEAKVSACRRVDEAILSKGASDHASTSPTSAQRAEPAPELSIPEFLDRRNVEEALSRLNRGWVEFRPLLQNAPMAARRRFVRDVLLCDGLVQKAADDPFIGKSFHRRSVTDERSSAT
jgi:hypothetical protein